MSAFTNLLSELKLLLEPEDVLVWEHAAKDIGEPPPGIQNWDAWVIMLRRGIETPFFASGRTGEEALRNLLAAVRASQERVDDIPVDGER